jgi:hypothetical protein
MEEFLATFSDFHQTIFSFLTVHSTQQLFHSSQSIAAFSQPQPNQIDPKSNSNSSLKDFLNQ